MDIFKKIFSTIKQKTAVITGGFDILKRATTSELNNKSYLQQYGKSLYVTACISKIAEKVASTQLELYKVLNSKGEMKELEVSPILDLLYRPNPFHTKTEFWETTIINLKCVGDAYWLKVRNKSGRVVELWNLRPDLVEITPDSEKFIKNYKFQKDNGEKVVIAKEDIVHFKYPDPMSQFFGLSPIQSASRRIQTEEFATAFQRDFFLNSARPDALIKNKNSSLKKEQKEDLKEGWNMKYRGIGNSSKVAILQGDLEYQQIAISQREMDYIESLKFTRDDILAAFKVPKPIVAIVDDVNRANSETAMFIFLSETIKPEVERICEKINEELVYPDFGDEFFVDFVDPTPENRDLKLREYAQGIASNYYLINEVRQMEGLEPIVGGWSIYLPFSSQATGGLPQGKKGAEKRDVIVKEYDNGPTNNKKIKLFNFRGHYWLKEKFLMKESISKSVAEVLTRANEVKNKKHTKGKKKEVKKTSYLIDPIIRNAFYIKTNEKIDKNTEKLAKDMTDFADKQKERVLKKLNKSKASEKANVSAKKLLNVPKETALTIDFIVPYIENYLKESAQESLLLLAPQEEYTDSKKIQAFIKARSKEFGESVTATTIEKLDATLAEGIAEGEGINSLSDRVQEVYNEFSTYRSDVVARTEATAANAKGALEGFRQSGVANGKEWINSGDSRVRDEHQDGIGVGGEIVGLDDNFSNGLSEPSEPNCRCVLGPAFIEE